MIPPVVGYIVSTSIVLILFLIIFRILYPPQVSAIVDNKDILHLLRIIINQMELHRLKEMRKSDEITHTEYAIKKEEIEHANHEES